MYACMQILPYIDIGKTDVWSLLSGSWPELVSITWTKSWEFCNGSHVIHASIHSRITRDLWNGLRLKYMSRGFNPGTMRNLDSQCNRLKNSQEFLEWINTQYSILNTQRQGHQMIDYGEKIQNTQGGIIPNDATTHKYVLFQNGDTSKQTGACLCQTNKMRMRAHSLKVCMYVSKDKSSVLVLQKGNLDFAEWSCWFSRHHVLILQR